MDEKQQARKPTFYLAHPFETREKTRQWELEIEAKYNINLLNPFYDLNRKDVDDIDNNKKGRYDIESPQELVERDLCAIYGTSGVVAVIDGSISYGTIMEIYQSFRAGLPVHIICTNGHENHPWLRYCAKEIFTSFEAFEKSLENEKETSH